MPYSFSTSAPLPDADTPQAEATEPNAAPDAPPRPTLRGLLWPLGLLTAGLVTIICVLLLFAAREQNELALKSSRHLAESALGNEISELKSAARDYAIWEDTLEKVVLGLDKTWADENIGTWAFEALKMNATLVLDGNDGVIYGMIEGERLGDEAMTRITEGLLPLVAAARKADPGELGVSLAGYVRIDDGIAIAAAAPIAWEGSAPAHDPDGAASVLIFFRVLDAALLERLSETFLLPGLHLSKSAGVDGASLPLATITGTVLGHLAWEAEKPGFHMLRPLLLPGALAGAIGLLLLAILIRRTARTFKELETSHSALQQQAVELAAARDRAVQHSRTESELRRNAVAASRAKSDFLALVSHELRTPLNAILGFSETIATHAFGRDATERYREYAADIHESGSHLLSIINDILDLTKVEAGRYELHDEDIDLDALLRRCLTLLRERAGAKGLALVREDSGIRLRADARALKQTVINLLSNAIKFTGPGGRVQLQASADTTGVAIIVRDSGIGMSPEQLARALQPFGQADSALSRSAEGTGLGLNVTKALTELHDGRLEINSVPGQGTTVTIHLPASRLLSGPGATAPGRLA